MARSDVNRDVIFYDGACGLCRRSTRWLDRLDWLGRLELRDMTQVDASELPVSQDEAMRGMPMRTRGGRTLVGFPAVRRALAQTVVGFLPALVLYIPGVSHAGAAAYNAIASNRHRETCDVCQSE
jgi:predicted DCC family thiol-disulfide oxidoreductase YuxK